MLKFTDRFAELCSSLGEKFVVFKGYVWKEYQKMVVPFGPVKLNYSITKDEAKYLLAQFPEALMVRWTDGFKVNTKRVCDNFLEFANNSEGGWYSVICSSFRPLEELPSKNRSEIRRGLRNCEVKRVEANFIAKNGYDVYVSALKRYKGIKPSSVSEKAFMRRMLTFESFEDIVHFWGAFYRDRLVAYSKNYIYDDIEANYFIIKLHPDFLKFYSSYALIYEMNRYYLGEHKFQYVNDGFRSVLHQTNIQNYLIKKFNFRKEYINLYIYYRPSMYTYLRLTFPVRKLIEKICPDPRLNALYKMEEIRRVCEKNLQGGLM